MLSDTSGTNPQLPLSDYCLSRLFKHRRESKYHPEELQDSRVLSESSSLDENLRFLDRPLENYARCTIIKFTTTRI